MTLAPGDLAAALVERQNVARHNRQAIECMSFSATMQPRTPLYVLEMDGALWPLNIDLPEPDFPPWAGIWSAKPKSFHSLGVAFDEPEPNYATHVGPLPRSEILPFLKELRRMVETALSRDEALFRINAMRLNNRWAWLIDEHGGSAKLLNATQVFDRL